MTTSAQSIEKANLPDYFEWQAELGHTKHIGGKAATDRLIDLCGIGPDTHLLIVGVGAGVSAAYIATLTGCRISGIDILPAMIDAAYKWADKAGIRDRVDYQVGDAQALPFDDDTFDALICQSVNLFVPDRAQAAREYARVVRPGGMVGLTESIWYKDPPVEFDHLAEIVKQPMEKSAVWEHMLDDAGLVEQVVETYPVEMRKEARDQFGLLGCGSYLRVFWRAIGFILGDPRMKGLLKEACAQPTRYFDYMGYGIYVGRVPA